MPTIGIVTLWGNINYGQRLQNYAVEKLLEEAGFEPLTLVVPSRHSESPLRKFKAALRERVKTPMLPSRRKAFDQFNCSYLHPLELSQHTRCDALVAGSDQIWNYTFPEFSSDMFLSFAGNRITASFAASFGVETVPDSLKLFYSKMLGSLGRISVREGAGVNLVKEICGRSAELLVDPTMALGASRWEALIRDVSRPDGPYAFDYFIGKRPDGLDARIREELGIDKVISFNNVKCPRWYDADPVDFVACISDSEVVVTDSFHGAVFAILFRKPFILYERRTGEKSMSSRLDTLLARFNLEDNRETRISSLRECKSPGIGAEKILEYERCRSLNFLCDTFAAIK